MTRWGEFDQPFECYACGYPGPCGYHQSGPLCAQLCKDCAGLAREMLKGDKRPFSFELLREVVQGNTVYE